MSEEITAGGKEFVFAMIWAAGLYMVCGIIMSLFGSYAFIGAIISIIIFCIFGFYVLTRYSARFTYTLKGNNLRVNRMIGKRNKEFEMKCSDIEGAYYGYKPMGFPRRAANMRKSIFSKKHSLYIEYRNKEGELCGIVIEPSEKLRKKIIKLKDKGRNND